MLARKNQLNNIKPSGLSAMERSRLIQARTLAQRRQDYAEVAEIDAKLGAFDGTPDRATPKDDHAEMLAKVNERNRKANLEAVRKAELAEAERKRRERKLAASGTPQPQDPSARLKTKPRLFNAATPTTRLVRFSFLLSSPQCRSVTDLCLLSISLCFTRPGTPSTTETPLVQPINNPTSRPVSPLPPSSLSASLSAKSSLEASVMDSIEIDLGDF
jgi:RNA polymerase-associated protein RTF1